MRPRPFAADNQWDTLRERDAEIGFNEAAAFRRG